MTKVGYIMREMMKLIKKHKFYFIAPMFIVLALIAFLVYYIGPAVLVSFIYAGV